MDSLPQKDEQLLEALKEQASKISEESVSVELGEQPATADPKSVSVSKNIINVAFVLFGLVGIAGSALSQFEYFDMDAYAKFLEVFAYIWAPLVIAVGGGRAFKNYVTRKYDSATTETK